MTSVHVMKILDDGRSLLACAVQETDPRAGRYWFEAAYREGELTGDADLMAEAVLGLCGQWVHEHRTAAASSMIEARLRHVRALVDPTTLLGLRLRIRAVAESDYRRGEHAGVMAVLDQARADAEPLARMEALSLAHHCLLGPEYRGPRRALAEDLIGEAGRAGHRGFLTMGLLWLVVDLFLAGDPHAIRRLGELRAMLADHENPAIEFVARAIEVMLTIRDGRLSEAEELALACHEFGSKVGDLDADGWYGAQLVAIRWYQGRLAELLPLLKDLVNSPTLSAVDNSFVAAYAVAAVQSGDERAAAAALATLRGASLAALPRSSSWLVTMYGVVEAAHLVGNDKAAARAYELLLPYGDLPMTASLAVSCFGSVQHALGVASLTMGELDRAVAHLREAVHRNLALGHWPAVSASRLRYAEALERRGDPADKAIAEEQRAEADAYAPSATPAGATVLSRHGTQWRVDLGTRNVLVHHSVGMLHLAVLTANPGAEIAAIDLAAGVEALGRGGGADAPGRRGRTRPGSGEDALGRAAAAGAMPAQLILDRAAVQQYRQRLEQLSEQIDDLTYLGDEDGAARATEERAWLLAELGANAGLGGRGRAFADGRERARLAVGRAIRRAIGHIERADPGIGAHLRTAVHTGAHCWYRPL
jgi:hypothetical protein